MAVKARPQTALILIPTQLFFGFLVELLNGMAAMGIINQLLQRGRGRQVAPVKLALLRLPTGSSLAQQPADAGFTLSCEAPGPQGDELFAQPALTPWRQRMVRHWHLGK